MAHNSSGSNGRPRFWGGFALGLVAGLALALAVTLAVTRNNPFVAAPPAPVAPVEQPATPAKPGSPAEAPTYDFYKSLPAGTSANVNSNPNPNPNAETPAPQFWLQAGAFQDPEEADNMKAKLALLGVEADIESAELADKGTIYRVRIGPLQTQEELDATRKRLTDNAIAAEPVKN
ncbi:MAG TPA: SPOR domain-containing protein [Thiobacillaceae bacterium]|nr:SPOR domain-containing protein [Thiobacillaceae bacterium]